MASLLSSRVRGVVRMIAVQAAQCIKGVVQVSAMLPPAKVNKSAEKILFVLGR